MSVEEYRTSTTTQSSYTTHNFNGHYPSVHNAHHQNRGQMQRGRPRSPFAYPTRLKRPGYRPSSPALSLSRSAHSGDVDRGSGTRTVSPASMYNMQRGAGPWQQVVNRSDPTLRYYPPMQGLPTSRGSTPRPAPSAGSVASSIRLSQVAVHYPGAWPVTPAATPPPLFYDYSEAFEEQTKPAEQTHVHRISVSIITSPVALVDDGQSRYWENPRNTESEIIVELPSGNLPAPIVELNVSRSENSRPNSVTSQNYAKIDVKPAPQPKPAEISVPSPPDLDSAVPRSPSLKKGNGSVGKVTMPSTQAGPVPSDYIQDQTAKTSDVRDFQATEFTEPIETTETVNDLDQEESSQVASTGSVQSSFHGEILEDSTEPTSRADTAEASTDGPPRTPINQTHSTEYLGGPPESQESHYSRTPISVERTSADFPEIVAPTPERSIISLSNRERFSKILGLEQGPHEQDIVSPFWSRLSNSGYAVDPQLDDDDAGLQRVSPTPTPRHSIIEENNFDDDDDDDQVKHGIMEAFERSNNSRYGNIASSTPTNVRLSHRKTVVNAGQTIEAKNETILRPSTILEDEVQEADYGSSSKDPKPIDVYQSSTTPPLSIKAFAPPKNTSQLDLPFAFTPLIQPSSEDGSSVDLDTTTSSFVKRAESGKETADPTSSVVGPEIDRVSTASPAASRPWNIDASYTWDDEEPPKLDVIMPLREPEPSQTGDKFPKFKLRIHRASSSTAASKLTKKNRSSDDTMPSVIASSVDMLKSASLRRLQKPRPSIAPGDLNSSHDIINTSPMQTRFIERFEQPSLASPGISLVPASPTDVRSFFSDDSSQGHAKGSLRKRISEFRARNNSRANSVDHVTSQDRGLLNSTCGIRGRTSRQDQTTTTGLSPASPDRPLRWSFLTRLRSWFSRRENGIRQWKRKTTPVAQTDNVELYAAV